MTFEVRAADVHIARLVTCDRHAHAQGAVTEKHRQDIS